MSRICICGAFRLGCAPKGGQEVKTCILADALEVKYGNIYRIDTLAKNSRLKMPFQLLWAMMTYENIIILPAHNGLLVLSKLLTILNVIFHRKIHYSVIGGWLPEFLNDKPKVKKCLYKFTGIYVETQTMFDALKKMGYNNIYVVPNCKPLSILNPNQLDMSYSEPYKLVTFSRVTEKKGIGTAASIVMKLNEKYGRSIFNLDIYGPIDHGDDEIWFNNQRQSFTEAISYKGNVDYDKSVEVLSGYFTLLFPTKYYTEGIPGTIIDSYAAGVPVIAAKWKSFTDVVIDKQTGLGYDFNATSELEEILEEIAVDPSLIVRMKKNCIEKAREFLPENAIKPLIENIK